MMALMTVTIAFTTAMKQEVMACTTLLNCAMCQLYGQQWPVCLLVFPYARCDSAHGCGCW